jgi:hypothetical protein
MLQAKFQDVSGSIYVHFAREQGDAVLGMTASEFSEIKEGDNG